MFPAEEGFAHQEDRRIRYTLSDGVYWLIVGLTARREVLRNDIIPGIVQRISRTPLTGWMVLRSPGVNTVSSRMEISGRSCMILKYAQ